MYEKILRTSFFKEQFKSITNIRDFKGSGKLTVIPSKFNNIKLKEKPVIIKQSNALCSNQIQLKFQLFMPVRRTIDCVYFRFQFTKYNNIFKNSTGPYFSVQHYSQNTFKQARSYRKWIILVIISGLSAGAGGYIALYPDTLKRFSKVSHGPEPTIPEQPKLMKYPDSSDKIPDEVPYLIIGGGTAAFTAFRAIKSSDPTAKVLVISNELYFPYMRPPLSKELIFNKSTEEGDNEFSFVQWNGRKRSVFYEPEEFYTSCEELTSSETGGVSVSRGWNVKQLDHNNKVAVLDDGKKIKYEKCLLATGSVPKQLPLLSEQDPEVLKKVLYYKSLKDFSRLEDILKEKPGSVAVIGCSFYSIELACSLARKGIKVIQICEEDKLLADVLPEYLSKSLKTKIEREGVNILNDTEIVQAKIVENKVNLTTKNGDKVTADHVIVALGMAPNTDLAQEAGLEIDKTLGGYVVNSEFEVRRDLYAAGDCASFYDVKYGRRRLEHHDHAILSGRLAGENMTGKGKIYQTQSMFWSEMAPEIGVEAIGVVDSSLPTVAVYAENPLPDSSSESKLSGTTNEDVVAQPMEFDTGVVFYLQNKLVVGILLWNLYNRVSIARRVLKSDIPYENYSELAKHFKIEGNNV